MFGGRLGRESVVVSKRFKVFSVFIEATGSDSDSDDGLFDRLDLAPVRKKMALDHENSQ